MKKLMIFGDSIIKGVTYNGQSYHLCQERGGYDGAVLLRRQRLRL